jgi:hypothetical protein
MQSRLLHAGSGTGFGLYFAEGPELDTLTPKTRRCDHHKMELASWNGLYKSHVVALDLASVIHSSAFPSNISQSFSIQLFYLLKQIHISPYFSRQSKSQTTFNNVCHLNPNHFLHLSQVRPRRSWQLSPRICLISNRQRLYSSPQDLWDILNRHRRCRQFSQHQRPSLLVH